jgi:hypothetical protein
MLTPDQTIAALRAEIERLQRAAVRGATERAELIAALREIAECGTYENTMVAHAREALVITGFATMEEFLRLDSRGK